MSREQSGKTPINEILFRYFVAFSIPYVLFLVTIGFRALPKIGELLPNYDTGWYPATYRDIIRTFALWSAAWYFGSFGVIFASRLVLNMLANFFWGEDKEYQAWKQGGGDIFFDSSAFSPDTMNARAAIPAPTDTCPRCGCKSWINNGTTCNQCGLFWQDNQWYSPQPVSNTPVMNTMVHNPIS
jgi:hypothetical protein